MAVGLEGDGLVAAAGPEEDPGDAEVDQRGHDGDAEPELHPLDRLRGEEAPTEAWQDAGRREHDEGALEAAGEVLGLAVPVAVVLVFGAGGGRQGEERHEGRGEVDQRLERVGEQADGAGDRRTPWP